MKHTGEYFILSTTQPRAPRVPFLFYLAFFAAWGASVISLVGEVFASILG